MSDYKRKLIKYQIKILEILKDSEDCPKNYKKLYLKYKKIYKQLLKETKLCPQMNRPAMLIPITKKFMDITSD